MIILLDEFMPAVSKKNDHLARGGCIFASDRLPVGGDGGGAFAVQDGVGVELNGQVFRVQPQCDVIRIALLCSRRLTAPVVSCQEQGGAIGGEGQVHAADLLGEETIADGGGCRHGAVGQADLEHDHRTGGRVVRAGGARVVTLLGQHTEHEIGVGLVEQGWRPRAWWGP